MLSDARCECGCRIFFNRQVVITTASGTIRDIPSSLVLECVRDRRVYLVSTDPGKKTLIPFLAGADSERMLFNAALGDWKNQHKPELNASMIVLEDADRRDFSRLGIEDPEMAKK